MDDSNPLGPLDSSHIDLDVHAEEDQADDDDGITSEEDAKDAEESSDSDESDDSDYAMAVDEEKVASTSTASRKAPAWMDPDDANLNVSLASNKRLRKLRDTVSEDAVGGREYERRLRRQFEKINPTPDWATKARTKLQPSKQKRRRSAASSDEESLLDDDMPNLLASTGGILGPRPKTLPQGTLSIERLRDANLSARSEGAIKAVQFHPSTQVPVMLTASEDRRLRLFNVRQSAPDIIRHPHGSLCRWTVTRILTYKLSISPTFP